MSMTSTPPDAQAKFIRQTLQEGLSFQASGRLDLAFECCKRVLQQEPDHFQALQLMGSTLLSAGQGQPAVDVLSRAIRVNPQSASAYYNRGLALQSLDRLDEAAQDYRRALALRPGFASACHNLGNVYRETHRLDDGLEMYRQSLALRPGHAPTQLNMALCLLKRGDYRAGFALYESRWRDTASAREAGMHDFRQPAWLGQVPIDGKTVLLHSEQGLGDTIQFARFTTRVKQLGARVLLEVPKALAEVLQGLDGVDELIVKGCPRPAFDLHCPLMSLPLALGVDMEGLDSPIHYLKPDPASVDHWRSRLGPRAGKRVGLVWSGHAKHKNDRQRSLAPAQVLPHLPAGIDYVCLQNELREPDRALMAAQDRIRYFGSAMDFKATAAVCELMDIVLSVDTSVAHLAAALGRPTWIMLPFSPDWRWHLEREDSVWYPSAKLYRQPSPGDWHSVLARVHADLAAN